MIYPFLISIVFLNSAYVHGAKYVETVDVTDSKGKSFSCKYVIFYTESGGPNVGNSKAECSPNKDGGSVELMLSIANYGDIRVKHFVRKNKDNIKSIVKVDIDETTTTTTPETTPTPTVPTELVIGSQQPFTANEMASMDPKPTLYMRDENGDTVHQVGSSSDPWIVTASIASGPGALANNVTCAFEQGLCVFGDLAIDTEGGDYSLSFELTHPSDLDTPIPAVVSYPFDVETRILSSEFTHLDILVPVNQTFNATVSVWDTALDTGANAGPSYDEAMYLSLEHLHRSFQRGDAMTPEHMAHVMKLQMNMIHRQREVIATKDQGIVKLNNLHKEMMTEKDGEISRMKNAISNFTKGRTMNANQEEAQQNAVRQLQNQNMMNVINQQRQCIEQNNREMLEMGSLLATTTEEKDREIQRLQEEVARAKTEGEKAEFEDESEAESESEDEGVYV